MKSKFVLFILIFSAYGIAFSQVGRLALSPIQTVNVTIAKTEVTLTYSRPAKRDRQIFGGLVPYGEVWRTGANRNTKITFSEDVFIGDTKLEKGMYAIFTKPTSKNWDIYFYTDTDNWDVPSDFTMDKVAAQINVPSHTSSNTLDSHTISIDEITIDQFELRIQWDKTMVSIPIVLTTEEQMSTTIADVLSGPDADDYFLAAQYRLESGRKLEEGLDWISKGIEMRKNPAWWDYRIKALILLELGKTAEAKPVAEKGLELANKHGSNYGIRELTKAVERSK